MSDLSRRLLVAGAAALPALAVPIAAIGATDQVYAMIETHQRAYDTWLVAEEAADIPEQKQPEARIVIKQFDRGELSASEKAADGSFF